MSLNEPVLQTRDLLLSTPEQAYRSSREHPQRSLSPSSIVSAVVNDAAATLDMVGCWAIPEDGAARGQPRRIVSAVAATSVTVDSAWSSTSGTTRIRIWKPAEIPFRTTGSGTTTTAVSADHDNVGVDSWPVGRGYFLLWLAGGNAGKAAKVTGWTAASGTATFTPALTSTVANELALLAKLHRPEGLVNASANPNFIKRKIVGYADADVAVKGAYAGTVAFETALRGIPTAGASGVTVVPPLEMGDMLADVLTENLDSGSTVASTASNQVTVASMEGANFRVGGFVLLSTGELAQIRSISGDVLSLAPGQSTYGLVEASSVVNGAAWYKRKTTGIRSRCFYYWRGGQKLQVFNGCAPTLKLSIARDQVVKFAWAYTAGEVKEYSLDRPIADGASFPITLLDSSVPTDTKGARCLLDGVRVLVADLSLDMGLQIRPRPSVTGENAMDGNIVDPMEVTGSMKIYADEDSLSGFEDIVDRLQRRDAIDFLYQKGTAPTETFGLAIPALQLTKAHQAYQNGQGVYECDFCAILPQVVPGNSADPALPALTLGWA